MAQRCGFTVSVTRKDAVEYSRTWEDWNHACDDYGLACRENRMATSQLAGLNKRALPYSAESAGVIVRIERAA